MQGVASLPWALNSAQVQSKCVDCTQPICGVVKSTVQITLKVSAEGPFLKLTDPPLWILIQVLCLVGVKEWRGSSLCLLLNNFHNLKFFTK